VKDSLINKKLKKHLVKIEIIFILLNKSIQIFFNKKRKKEKKWKESKITDPKLLNDMVQAIYILNKCCVFNLLFINQRLYILL